VVKKKKRMADRITFEKIEKLHGEKDKKEFFRLIKQMRGKRKHTALPTTMIDPTNNVHTKTESETLKAWQNYFAVQGIEAENDPLFDNNHYHTIRRTFSHHRENQHKNGPAARVSISVELSEPLSMDEVRAALLLMKTGKARDPNGIINELLTRGGEIMITALHTLLSEIWKHEYIPGDWLTAIIIPLYKNSGSRAAFASYRPIALMSVVCKLYETILHKRMSSRLESQQLIGDEQGGFRPGRSTMDHVFVLTEIIAHRRERKQATFLCFLDLSKAYDLTWREGVWDRLLSVGMHGKIWRVIVDMYRSVRSRVVVNGQPSDEFISNVGVRQGSVLSPLLFSVFLSGVIDEWRAKGLGVRIASGGKHRTAAERNRGRGRWPQRSASTAADADAEGSFSFSFSPSGSIDPTNKTYEYESDGQSIAGLLFADDIVLVAGSIEELQHALEIMEQHARRWRYKFNQSKCAVMCIARRKPTNTTWMLQGKPIAEHSSYKYLGVPLTASASPSSMWNAWNEQSIAKGRAGLPVLWFCGARQAALPFTTAANLIDIFLYPAMAYGSEVAAPAPSVAARAERVVNAVNRQLLGSPSYRTSAVAMRRELGAFTMGARRDLAKLQFLFRLQSMPNGRLTKQVFLARLASNIQGCLNQQQQQQQLVAGARAGVGWTAVIRAITQEHGLLDYLTGGESDSVTLSKSQLESRKREWRKRVVCALTATEARESDAHLVAAARDGSAAAAFYCKLIGLKFNRPHIDSGNGNGSGAGPGPALFPFTGRAADYLVDAHAVSTTRGRRLRTLMRLSSAPLAALQARHWVPPAAASPSATAGQSPPSALCANCGLNEEEDQVHAMCVCPAHAGARAVLFEYIGQQWSDRRNHDSLWFQRDRMRFTQHQHQDQDQPEPRVWSEMDNEERCLWMLSTTEPDHCAAVDQFLVGIFAKRAALAANDKDKDTATTAKAAGTGARAAAAADRGRVN
jgi:hypothetical protein